MTVGELGDRMSSLEYERWKAFVRWEQDEQKRQEKAERERQRKVTNMRGYRR